MTPKHNMYFRTNLCVALKNSLVYMTFMTLFSTSLHGSVFTEYSSVLFILITPGNMKGTNLRKKTLITSRFLLCQYVSFGFHSRAKPACFFMDLGGFQILFWAWIFFKLVLGSHSNGGKLKISQF